MLAAIKKHWREFKGSRPGHRFQERYKRRKEEHRGGFHWSHWLNIGAGSILAIVGVFLLPAPGPGMLVVVAGLALLGSEFLTLARFLDWAEVRLRKSFHRARRWWGHSGWVMRTSVILLVCLMAAGAIFGGYSLLMKS